MLAHMVMTHLFYSFRALSVPITAKNAHKPKMTRSTMPQMIVTVPSTAPMLLF